MHWQDPKCRVVMVQRLKALMTFWTQLYEQRPRSRQISSHEIDSVLVTLTGSRVSFIDKFLFHFIS